MTERFFIILAAANMFFAVGAGAFGAHGLKKILTVDMLEIWHTAVTYQMAHAIGLFVVALLMPRLASTTLNWAGSIMFVGIILFSGSLYVLALSGVKILGAVTPLGGVAFLLSWILIGWAAYKG